MSYGGSDLTDAVARLLRRADELLVAPPDPRASSLAIALCERAVEEAPDCLEARKRLAWAVSVHGRDDEAIAVCDEALVAHPEAVEVRLQRLLLTIPFIYVEAAQVDRARAAYEARLDDLERHMAQAPPVEVARLAQRAQEVYSYRLAYQGLNDAPLQRRLGSLMHRAMVAAHPEYGGAVGMPGLGGRLRVGFVSSHFGSSTIWHVVTRGWLAGLRARGFECYGYSLGKQEDACTEVARSLCSRFVSGERPFREWCETIRGDDLHALIYPTLGYSTTVCRLGLLRLAPVQCVSVGHWETSGYPSMDYFLSGALMEPCAGDDHYTERLVRLPDLGFSYPPARVDPSSRRREHPGLRRGAVLYFSPHLPKKYLPQHDELYARIAESVPGSQVVFVRHPSIEAISRVVERRLRGAFAAQGVDVSGRLVFLDRLSRSDYESLLMSADVYLDVPGWNGGTTTAEALVRHLPVVTLEGEVARGRMGAAMLRHLGVTDGLAHTAEQYVQVAAGLGRDAAWRADVRHRVALTSHRIHDDHDRVAGLAAFLEGAVRRAGTSGSTAAHH